MYSNQNFVHFFTHKTRSHTSLNNSYSKIKGHVKFPSQPSAFHPRSVVLHSSIKLICVPVMNFMQWESSPTCHNHTAQQIQVGVILMTEDCVPQKGSEHTVIPVAIASIMLCGNNGKKQICLLQS